MAVKFLRQARQNKETFVKELPWMISVKFDCIWPSDFREDQNEKSGQPTVIIKVHMAFGLMS